MPRPNNLSAVLYAKDDLRMEHTDIPEPGPDEVEVAVHTVGICGTDIHFWEDGYTGKFVLEKPMVLGHETSAVVTKVGSEVKHLAVGDHVVLEPNLPCHICDSCKTGRYNLCQRISLVEVTPLRGHLRRYTLSKGNLAHKIPKHVSMDEAAMIEPFAVAVQACKRAGITAGQRVLITGTGPIGLLCLLAVKAYGVGDVVMIDIDDNKLAMAKKCGADQTLNVKGVEPQEAAKKINQLFGGFNADVTLECTGAQSCDHIAVYATRPGGCVAVVGMGQNISSIPIMDLVINEIDFKGVFCYANCYATAISLLATGRVNFKPLITHTFNMEDTLKAFDIVRNRVPGAIKVQVKCYQE